MALTYACEPGAEISGADSTGRDITVTFSKSGRYSTEDAGEIAMLDALADLESHPVSHADAAMTSKES